MFCGGSEPSELGISDLPFSPILKGAVWPGKGHSNQRNSGSSSSHLRPGVIAGVRWKGTSKCLEGGRQLEILAKPEQRETGLVNFPNLHAGGIALFLS